MQPTFKCCGLAIAGKHHGNRFFKTICFSVVFVPLRLAPFVVGFVLRVPCPSPLQNFKRSFHIATQIMSECFQNHVYTWSQTVARKIFNHGGSELNTCQDTRHNDSPIAWQCMLNLWIPELRPIAAPFATGIVSTHIVYPVPLGRGIQKSFIRSA